MRLNVARFSAWMGLLALSLAASQLGCSSDSGSTADAATAGGGGSGGKGGAAGLVVDAATDVRGDAAPVLTDIVDTAVANGNFTKLAAALTAADLVTTLKGAGPFTVFAPTDAAFAKLPADTLASLLAPTGKASLQNILKYHVVANAVKAAQVVTLSHATTVQGQDVAITVNGTTVKVNDATVTVTDVLASNGVIHVIDTVLIPPSQDIVDTAVAAGGFTKLAAALTAADLVTTLKGTGPFTVFAPTDAAFDKLPAATLTMLLSPAGKAQLVDILTYHVVSGKVYAGDVVKLTKATTVEGKDIAVAVTNGGVTLNGTSNVTATNILATNGVIHVIDTVLVPPQ